MEETSPRTPAHLRRPDAQRRVRSHTVSLSRSLMAFCLVLAATAGSVRAASPPTLTRIVPDGQMGDWSAVLANPRNVTLDGDASSQGCLTSPDRDCPIASPSFDMRRFAWTYDTAALYLFFERFSPGDLTPTGFFLLLDLDRDGLMTQGTDRVVVLTLDPVESELSYTVRSYVPGSPGGDPLADALGFVDGFSPPQPDMEAGAFLAGDGPFDSITVDHERFEVAIPWADLGGGPAPALFHGGTFCCFPSEAPDNFGGPDDRAGDMGFHAVTLEPPGVRTQGPGAPILHPHDLKNAGNLDDAFALHVLSSEGLEVRIHTDPDGDGDPSDGLLLGTDKQGDGDFTGGGDFLGLDRDGDTFPETDVLPPGGTAHLVVEVVPGNGNQSFQDETRLTARSLGDGTEGAVVDRTIVAEVAISPPWDLSVEAGTTIHLAQELWNFAAEDTCVDFRWFSALGWNSILWTDPDGDGDPSDGVPLGDDCGGVGSDLMVPAGGSVPFVIETRVPASAPLGSVETLLLEGLTEINGERRTSVTHSLRVDDLYSLTPAYRLSDGTARSGGIGRTLFLPHVLRNSGPNPATFGMSSLAPPGHAVTLFTDPDGDGFPSDGRIVGAGDTVGPLAPYGGDAPLIAALEISPSAVPGEILSLTLEAVLQEDPTVRRTVTDEVVVSRIAGFADPLFFLQPVVHPRCDTVFALATGLVPGQSDRYRLRWVDDSQASNLRIRSLVSDGAGESTDVFSLPLDGSSGAHSIRLEEWTGFEWLELDQFPFLVSEGWAFLEATPRDPIIPLRGDIRATIRFENPGENPTREGLLALLVLDPTGSRYLRGDGTFAPFTPGDWTRTAGPWDLDPGARLDYLLAINDVAFPEAGLYTLRATSLDACGSEDATLETTFQVSDDQDGDGWLDAEETVRGTDPLDADTDDDGLPDPLDGDGDADGDGSIDALECDADGDGLPDSVEAGLDGTGLLPDTDLSTGCFRADGDAGATITLRLDPDSDAGGLEDGVEDANANGVLDPGEKDPRDGTDDPCRLVAPGEARDLRVRRLGENLQLSWTAPSDPDPCLSYTLLRSDRTVPDDLTGFGTAASGLTSAFAIDTGMADAPGLHHYLVRADGRIAGSGTLGHYGR